jgi:hypothetical protein
VVVGVRGGWQMKAIDAHDSAFERHAKTTRQTPTSPSQRRSRASCPQLPPVVQTFPKARLMSPIQDRCGDLLRSKKLAFLVGSPRSGTTWLQLLLSRSPLVVTAQETHLFNVFLRSMLDQWPRRSSAARRVGVQEILSDAEFSTMLRGVSGFVLAKIARRNPSASIILEKTPDHIRCWPEILDLWPDAHFIHIIRDPRSVVASIRIASKSWASEWASSKLSTGCERWVTDVTVGRQIRAATLNYQEVTFEDLKTEGAKAVERLLCGLGVETSLVECQRYVDDCNIINLKAGKLDDAPFAMTNENESYRKGEADSWRIELSKWEIAFIERMAGPLMSELGYATVDGSRVISALVGTSCRLMRRGRAIKRRLRRFLERRRLIRGA